MQSLEINIAEEDDVCAVTWDVLNIVFRRRTRGFNINKSMMI
jgi:hypothetical protein